jgi:acetyltransferase-like isoleucine patch superfamily enzyme
MKRLLILGAGQYGQLAKEIAEAMGCFSEIAFLDDSSSEARGKLSDYHKFKNDFDFAIVAIGNPDIRQDYFELLKPFYKIATLIHSKAYVSPSAKIGEGSVIEPMAIIQTASHIGKSCFISSGAVIRHNSIVGDFCHCDCNSIVKTGSVIEPKSKIESFSCK